MNATGNSKTCQTICWLLAALAGLIVFLITDGVVGFLLALVLGIAVLVGAGIALKKRFCESELNDQRQPEDLKTAPVSADPTQARPAADPVPGPAPEDPKPTVAEAQEPQAAPAPDVGMSTQLPGQQELAARKGTWRYEPETSPQEGAGSAPDRLDGAREGQPDNLKLIKGVGPKLEALLHRMGYFHFDQVANWTASDVAWMDDNLEGFKGRVTRDDWVAQAKILASGGETEFSRRES